MDLGSVINDCGDKHYNTGDASGYLYVMQMGRHDHPRSIVTDHPLIELGKVRLTEFKMYDLEKASKSAHGISLYVSDDPQGSNEVLGPDAPSFPDQDGALVYELPV